MARIRTIKPEFWTDEIVVQLPFEARLLFIGLWNFADDYGTVLDKPDRLRLQIFPADTSLDVGLLCDLLVACGLLDRYVAGTGERALKIVNWGRHQKVDNPGKASILGEDYRKLAIPREARRALATKYGCAPGGRKDCSCYFCGAPGEIIWWPLASGKPSSWVVFAGLELDHFEPERNGGKSAADNLVLSCRECNRGRCNKDALEFISRKLSSPREESPSSLGRESKGREGKGSTEARAREPSADQEAFAEVKAAYPRGIYPAADWLLAERHACQRVEEGAEWGELLAGVRRYAAQCTAKGSVGTQFVLSPQKFFAGGPAPKFREPFPLPATKAETRLASNVTAADEFMRRTEGAR